MKTRCRVCRGMSANFGIMRANVYILGNVFATL